MTIQEKLAKLDEAIDTMKEVLAELVSMRERLINTHTGRDTMNVYTVNTTANFSNGLTHWDDAP